MGELAKTVKKENKIHTKPRKEQEQQKKKKGRRRMEDEELRHDGSLPFKSAFSLFVGSPRRDFLRLLHDSPLSIAFEEVLFFSCS